MVKNKNLLKVCSKENDPGNDKSSFVYWRRLRWQGRQAFLAFICPFISSTKETDLQTGGGSQTRLRWRQNLLWKMNGEEAVTSTIHHFCPKTVSSTSHDGGCLLRTSKEPGSGINPSVSMNQLSPQNNTAYGLSSTVPCHGWVSKEFKSCPSSQFVKMKFSLELKDMKHKCLTMRV